MHQSKSCYAFKLMNIELKDKSYLFRRIYDIYTLLNNDTLLSSCYPSSMRITYPCIHEYKIHLAEGKDHLKNWIDSTKHLIAWRVPRYFKECSKLQTIVNHSPQAKCYKEKFHDVAHFYILCTFI